MPTGRGTKSDSVGATPFADIDGEMPDRPTPPRPAPTLGVMMRCCNVYVQIRRVAAGDAYAGHCPRCAKPVRVPIATDGTGTKSRIFEAG